MESQIILVSKFQLHYNLILNLISNKQVDMTDFSSKSMIQNEIEREYKTVLDEIESIKARIAGREETLRMCRQKSKLLTNIFKKSVLQLNKQRRRNREKLRQWKPKIFHCERCRSI